MSSFELVALVAGGADYGESDRVVHLITPQGRVDAFAHGAKKSKKRFAGALEPFNTITVEISPSRRTKAGLPTLASASIQKVRLGIRSELHRIALASYIVELSVRTAPEGAACQEQFDLTQVALDALDAGPASVALRRAFDLRLLAEQGYAPQLSACVQCGLQGDRSFLDLQRGGTLCIQHRGTAKEVGPKTLQWARAVLSAAHFDADAGCERVWADTAAKKMGPALSQAWQAILDRPLNALSLLETVDV